MFFALAAVMVLIVMMNLLISIVSDTFEKVQVLQIVKDVEGRIRLLLEIHPFFRKDPKENQDKKYIAVAEPFSEDSDSWEGRIRAFYDKIKKL